METGRLDWRLPGAPWLAGGLLVASVALGLLGRERGAGAAALSASPAATSRLAVYPPWAHVSSEQIAAADRLGVPVAYRDSVGMRFVLVPGRSESPVIEPFYLQVFETTVEEFQRWPDAPAPPERPWYLAAAEEEHWEWRRLKEPWHWQPAFDAEVFVDAPGNALRRLGEIPRHDRIESGVAGAQASDAARAAYPLGLLTPAALEGWIAWLRAQYPERTYRLPREAEWEHACRAGRKTKWPWGNGVSGWRSYASWSRRRLTPSVVGSHEPNDWGLHDMLGNVAECCRDAEGGLVLRGGSVYWVAAPPEARLEFPPAELAVDGLRGVGVRLVIEIKASGR